MAGDAARRRRLCNVFNSAVVKNLSDPAAVNVGALGQAGLVVRQAHRAAARFRRGVGGRGVMGFMPVSWKIFSSL